MGKIKHFVVILGVIALLGCEKRPETLEEYLPQVEMISAEITPEGKIAVRARLISEGPRGVHYLGFCADDVPNPKIDANQVLTSYLYGDEFVAIIGGTFHPGTYSELYVNAFAANDFAYSTGVPIFVDSTANVGIRQDIYVPCELEINEVSLFQNTASQTYASVSPALTSGGISTFTAKINTSLYVKFSCKKLDQKIYTSTSSLSQIDEDKMLVNVIQYGTENPISPGTDIYVNRIEDYTFEVVICGANWGFNNTMKTRVRVSL